MQLIRFKFKFETSRFDERTFFSRLQAGLATARDEAARLFLKEMYQWFNSGGGTGHVWSGAAQATLMPLTIAVRATFRPKAPRENWEQSFWSLMHLPKDDPRNCFWWSQHGVPAGWTFGGGTISDFSTLGDWHSMFVYWHSLLHFSQLITPNQWDALMEAHTALKDRYAQTLKTAMRHSLHPGGLFTRNAVHTAVI